MSSEAVAVPYDIFPCIIFAFSMQDKAKADWNAIQCHGQISKWEVVALAVKQREVQEQEAFCLDGLTPHTLSLKWRRK